jgi:2-polyprenyl-6-methoxyphenol hydroxylase-like FAD-dependent oxidoreductase
MRDTEVLIVGGGPVGLALAGELGWRGVRCHLVEQTDGVIGQPKMDGVNVRTMEFCRRWGIVDDMKAADFPRDYPQDMVYLTSIAGHELGREVFATPSGGVEERKTGHSPESRIRCPQTMFDPILQKRARSFEHVELSYEHRFLGFDESERGVTARVQDLSSGEEVSVAARYLVACDGGGSGVRQAIGAEPETKSVLTYSTNVMFRCPDLYCVYNKPLAYRHFFIGTEGTWGSMVAISGRDVWRLSIIGVGRNGKLTAEEVDAAIRRAIGADVPFEVISAMPWARRELIATRFGRGRVFLAGDAAHVMSPTGGFGMNTGIADAVDLAWKLEGVLRGWGGPRLLESYDAERRPIAQRTVREATGNLMRTLSPGEQPRLLEPTREGAITRYNVGRRFAATMLREWYKLGVDLAYAYEGSPICRTGESIPSRTVPSTAGGTLPAFFSDGSPVTSSALRERQRLAVHLAEGTPVDLPWEELPAEEVMVFPYGARLGARAPHAWLEDGRSTLDLLGKEFTLLSVGADPAACDALIGAAAAVNLPLAVAECIEPQVRRAYGARMLLIRPDQHIAWMGDALPSNGAPALVDRIRGA